MKGGTYEQKSLQGVTIGLGEARWECVQPLRRCLRPALQYRCVVAAASCQCPAPPYHVTFGACRPRPLLRTMTAYRKHKIQEEEAACTAKINEVQRRLQHAHQVRRTAAAQGWLRALQGPKILLILPPPSPRPRLTGA